MKLQNMEYENLVQQIVTYMKPYIVHNPVTSSPLNLIERDGDIPAYYTLYLILPDGCNFVLKLPGVVSMIDVDRFGD